MRQFEPGRASRRGAQFRAPLGIAVIDRVMPLASPRVPRRLSPP